MTNLLEPSRARGGNRSARRRLRPAAALTLAVALLSSALTPAAASAYAGSVHATSAYESAAGGAAAQMSLAGSESAPVDATQIASKRADAAQIDAMNSPWPAPQDLSVLVTDVSPTAVTLDDEVRVTVTVTNTGAIDITAPRIALDVVRYRIASRTLLREWLAGEQYLLAPTRLTHEDLDEPLAPGASRSVVLTTPATDLQLLPYPESSGPRGLIVSLSDRDHAGTLWQGRGFLQWYPAALPEPVRLSVLATVTGPAATPLDPAAWGALIAAETAPQGRLSQLTAATEKHRDVAWITDPSLVSAAADGLGGLDGSVWATSLLAAATGREVFATDPFDPDLTALARAGVSPFYPPPAADVSDTSPQDPPAGDTSPTETDPTAGASDDPNAPASLEQAALTAMAGWRTDVAVAVPGTIGDDLAKAMAEQKRSALVLDPSGDPQAGTPTPSGKQLISTGSTTLTGLQPDSALTELFLAAGNPDLSTDLRAHARHVLLADLSAVTQENPAVSTHVLIATGRSWNPQPQAVSTTLSQVDAAAFVELSPLSSLIGAAPVSSEEITLPSITDLGSALRPAIVTDLAEQAAEVIAFSQIASDPAALTKSYLSSVAAATSVAWRTNTMGRRDVVKAATELGDRLIDSITVVPGSDLNLISDRGNLPVRLRNELTQPVTVGVLLAPDDVRLSIQGPQTVTIGPGDDVSVEIPVRAIGSGNVTVAVKILGPDGTVVADPSSFQVRVRADWEGAGTIVIGVLVALLFAGGLIRTVRGGRSATRMDPVRPAQEDEE